MAANRKTLFNKLWTDKTLFPDLADWVEEVEGSSSEAACKFCRVAINLGNMGRTAHSNHAAGAKHQKYVYCRTNVGQGILYCQFGGNPGSSILRNNNVTSAFMAAAT
jgi:hypothetical protein